MATFLIDAKYTEAPGTPQMKRFDKAVEFVYYVMLFCDEYTSEPDVWKSWLDMGFHTGIRNAPPGAKRPDRILLSTKPAGKHFEISVVGGNPRQITKLKNVLDAVESVRAATSQQSDDHRLGMLLKDVVVCQHVIEPLGKALSVAGVTGDGENEFSGMMKRSLLALTDRRIRQLKAA